MPTATPSPSRRRSGSDRWSIDQRSCSADTPVRACPRHTESRRSRPITGLDRSGRKVFVAALSDGHFSKKREKWHPAIPKTFLPCLLPASPIARSSTAVGHCKHCYFQKRFLIDDGEGKLPKRVFAEIAEVEGPALRSLSDSFHRVADGNFKLFCRDQTLIAVSGQC